MVRLDDMREPVDQDVAAPPGRQSRNAMRDAYAATGRARAEACLLVSNVLDSEPETTAEIALVESGPPTVQVVVVEAGETLLAAVAPFRPAAHTLHPNALLLSAGATRDPHLQHPRHHAGRNGAASPGATHHTHLPLFQ